jgi:hypothetical protein
MVDPIVFLEPIIKPFAAIMPVRATKPFDAIFGPMFNLYADF